MLSVAYAMKVLQQVENVDYSILHKSDISIVSTAQSRGLKYNGYRKQLIAALSMY